MLPEGGYTPIDNKDDKLAKVQNQVEEIKITMQQNIDKAISRGEKLEIMEEKADKLHEQSKIWERGTYNLRNKLCRDAWKSRLCIIFTVLFVLGIGALIIYELTK